MEVERGRDLGTKARGWHLGPYKKHHGVFEEHIKWARPQLLLQEPGKEAVKEKLFFGSKQSPPILRCSPSTSQPASHSCKGPFSRHKAHNMWRQCPLREGASPQPCSQGSGGWEGLGQAQCEPHLKSQITPTPFSNHRGARGQLSMSRILRLPPPHAPKSCYPGRRGHSRGVQSSLTR